MADEQRPTDESHETHERFVLPLVVPAMIFLFAVLVIYGLSRIYLELDQWKFRTVSMATPLAIGIALTILLVSTYLAGRPRIARWQVAGLLLFAAAGLTSGAIWASVHTDETVKAVVPTTTATPGGTPATGGGIAVTLHDSPFKVAADPVSASAGSVTFNVSDTGSTTHNFRVAKTELAVDKLPVNADTFAVDESQVTVAASGKNLLPGASEVVTVQLEAGSYVLFCNIPTHYTSGMRVAFTVK